MFISRFDRLILGLALALVFFAAACEPTAADVRLPSIFSDHMVLQQGKPFTVWGWADPGEKVTVTLGDCTVDATACEKGKWAVKLAAMKAGGEERLLAAEFGPDWFAYAERVPAWIPHMRHPRKEVLDDRLTTSGA